MAYQEINKFILYEYEQEEIIESNQVADPDTGIVETVTTLKQPYVHIWADFTVYQETIDSENRSNLRANLTLYGTAGEEGDGFTLETRRSAIWDDDCAIEFGTWYQAVYYADTKYKTLTVAPGETKSLSVIDFDSTSAFANDRGTSLEIKNLYHNFDGTFTRFQDYDCYKYYPRFNVNTCFRFTGNYEGTEVTNKLISKKVEKIEPTYLLTNRGLLPTTANNFTDEENPSFTYAASGQKFFDTTKITYDNDVIKTDTITSLQVGLSLDGETLDIDYREIPVDGTSYTFNLSDVEKELLRQKAQGSDTVPIYYMTKTAREYYQKYSNYTSDFSQEFENKLQRNFTIVGCNPTLNPTVVDIKPETLALTGDENTFVRYESMAEFAINAQASKGATIVSQSVTCGSKTISNLPNGVIDDVESGTFIFNVTDSRNMGASSSVFKNLIEYVKPTCYQKVRIDLSGETGAVITLEVNGNYFNGSFGAADNTLKLEVRHTDNNGTMGAWKTLSGTPTFNGTTYELEATLTGFDYGKAYIFQCRATDKLNVVESSQYTVRVMPVFDWGETDFNFNVPVNIDAEDLSMHGETIIRHSDTTNNTVLSASNGHIYVRPRGTDSTYNETIFYNNGDVNFSGDINAAGNATFGGTVSFDGSFSINGDTLNDYVIATGSDSMGSNGTWYWRKWASGTAEAWGCRNFGNMAITTAWGNLYRSAVFTQDLPDNVFIRTPDAININIVHSNFGGWICKHEQTAPSAVTTGSFIFVRPASATATPTNIGFYIVGEWK